MPDFPARSYFWKNGAVLSSHGDTILGEFLRFAGSNPTSTAYTTANTALFYPITIAWPFLAQQMAVQVSTQSGNMDVGIYDEKGNRLVSMGSTAVGVAGLQTFNIADTWLMPGTYFAAINVDNTTASFQAISTAALLAQTGRVCGLQAQAVGAVTLPNPATFAAWTLMGAPTVIIGGATI